MQVWSIHSLWWQEGQWECYSDICCCARERIEIPDPTPTRTPTPTLKLPKTHVKKKPSGKFLIAIYMARFE
ncbi:hypothetical protein TVAGG3_0297150 [Trichomonas vaginalis G3]|uniref:hypothetical protein n=1 Tax=Trichomonas vaginalis (strain ATCC PRA-98 / G3) TaxID=412133 RepID=UPI0021E5E406|nr:hypothetical protein TVAGG3_0297150 [Trichomonas vaginalis G3]KAI5527684.1 hypothetical protein TVAGG3_0297150 [Trichomonas vaginalis G3]